MRTAWFHCFSGVAGDMVLGALLDAGADVDEVRTLVSRVPVAGWRLDCEPTQRAGLQATRAIVHAPEDLHHPRTFTDVARLITEADLPDRVSTRALAVFTALAEAEGRLHGVLPAQVHFHEVGALDAIVDVVGTCAALEVLDVDDMCTSPVAVGLGSVSSAHGQLPNPAPATIALLASAGIAVHGVASEVELATPTGAALLAGLAGLAGQHGLAGGSGPLPAMIPEAVGYGAGGRDLPGRANVVQVVIGVTDATASSGAGHGQPLVELAVNVDDATGEILAHALAALLAAGANDAWITPIVMKKGRPAHTLHALCDPALAPSIGAVLIAESGSLGYRSTPVERWPQVRDDVVVELGGHALRVKRAGSRVKAEHDDAVRAAAALGRPLREVLAEAERLALPPSD